MKKIYRTVCALCAFLMAFAAMPLLPTAHTAAAQANQPNDEARVIVRLIAEHPEQCPSDNLRAYTYIYIEGKGVPDANGYIFATAHATTDLTIIAGRVVSLAPRHHEMTYTIAIRLEQFPPVPITGIDTMYSLDIIPLSNTPPQNPDVTCIYLNDKNEPETVTGNQEFVFRQLINTLKGAIYGLGGMQRNAVEVYGVEGIYRARQNSTFKYVAEWYPGVVPGFDVVPDVKGLFIGGVPIEVYYDYISLWDDDGLLNGTASIKHGRNGWEQTQQPAPDTVRKTINPGTAINQTTQMEGQVALNNGNGSNMVKKPFDSTPKLSVFKPDEVDPTKVGEEVAYKFERAMPNPAWEAKYKFPQSFPAPLKGKGMQAKAQFKILLETSSLQAPTTIKAGLGGEGEVEIGKVAGKLSGEGSAEFNYTKAGFDLNKGSGKVDFQIGIKETYGPFDLVPQFKPAISSIGLDTWLEQYLKVEVGLYAIAVGNMEVFKGAGGLDWKAKVQPGLRVTAKGVAGKEEGNFGAEVEAKGEGRLNLFINDPPNPFFGGADGEVSFTASFVFFDNKASYENKITFAIGNSIQNANVLQASQTLAAPAQLSLASAGYGGGVRWMGDAPRTSNTTEDATTVILAKASPLASPSMSNNGQAACWVSQRPDAPAARNSEIVCATGSAPSFATPVTLTNDSLADASPSVALAAPNAPIAAWWRNTDAALSQNTPLDPAYLNKTDVMVSAFDPASGNWSAPLSMGTTNTTDYAPQVSGNGAGNGLLVWRENTTGQIGGLGSTPDTVKATLYNAGSKTWATPQGLTRTAGLVAVQSAYGTSEAAVVYAIDANPVATTTLDTEIWAQRFVGGAWQAPTRLTNDADADTNPRLAYDASGQPVLAWLRTNAAGETFVMLQRGWGNPPTSTKFDGVNAPAVLRDMAINANGDVALVWPAVYEGVDVQSDLAYAVFNAASNTWTAPTRLTHDAAHDDFANLAWKSATEFSVLYDRVALQTLTDTVTIDGAAKPYTYTAPNPNGHDLVVLSHALLPAQPAVQPGGLSIGPANAAPGAPATVVAQVSNLGNLPASTVQVVIGLSDARQPVQNANAPASVTPIATATLPALRGGETLPVSLTVTLPAQPNRLVALVSCASGCAAAPSPSAVLTTTLPDLAVVSVGPDRNTLDGATLVRAEIVNTGVISATRAQMTVMDDSGVLGTSEVYITPTTGLLPGQSVQGYFMLDAATEFTGSKALTVSVRLLDAAGEMSLNNNVASFGWVRLPDWTLTSGGVALGAASSAGTPITITAYNESDVVAPAVTVQVFSTHPDEGGTLLWQGAMPSANAWGHARVTAKLPGSVSRAFVRVNAPEVVSEMSIANNTARAGRGFTGGGVQFKVFVPVIRK